MEKVWTAVAALMRRSRPAFYTAIGLGALLLYALTVQRGFSWQDSGEFQYRILIGDYHWCSGIARAHPLYIAAARGWMRLFPHRFAAGAVNLFSGVGMAVAVAFLAAGVRRVTGSLRAACVAAVLLAFAHMAWWLATIAEVYTWSLAFLLAEVYAALRFFERRTLPRLALLFFLNGLHLAVHNFALLDTAVWGIGLLAVWLRGEKEPDRASLPVALLTAGAAWLAGAGWILWLAVEHFLQTRSLAGTLQSVLFGHEFITYVLGTRTPKWKLVLGNYALTAVSFLNPCWLLAAAGLRRMGERTAFRNALVGLTAVHVIFWCRYFVGDQATFILPTLGLLAWWAGVGAARLEELGKRRVLTVGMAAGVVCACLLPWIAAQALERADFHSAARWRTLEGRKEYAYWLIPWKQNESSAQDFVTAVGKQLQTGDLLFADNTAAAPLLAARAAGAIPDDWFLSSYLNKPDEAETYRLLGQARRAYIVSPVEGYFISDTLASPSFSFEKEGILYRIRNQHPADSRQ